MLKDLQWFQDREGSYIMRGTTEVFITNEIAAKKMFEMQDEKKKYFFDDKVVTYRARPEECETCSA